MRVNNKTKKLILIFLVAVVLSVGFLTFVADAAAQGVVDGPNKPAPTVDSKDAGLAQRSKWSVLGWLGDTMAGNFIDGLVALAELVRNAIFLGPVLLISIVFDYAVWFNVAGNILNTGGVKIAWGVMQSLANMFFILILLWIALATIFDFEEYTMKKLLPKLIIMALLINFSLVITAMVVDVANGLGYYFYKQMTGKSNYTFVQIFNNLNVARTLNVNNQTPDGVTTAQIEQNIDKAYANDLAKNLGFREDNSLQVAATAAKKVVAEPFYQPGQKTSSAVSRLAALIMTTAAGIVLLVVMILGIGFLIARSVTIMFLGIFSPLVFLANILPQTREHWNKWWEKLTQQAFFAPAYLFCLLATFKFLEVAKVKTNQLGNAEASIFDPGFLFLYMMAIVMMIASLIVAQKMSIALSAATVGFTKKYAAKTAKELGAKMAAGGAGKFLESGAGAAMARMPLLRNIPQAAVQIQAAEAKRAKERAELYAKLAPQDLARDFNKYSKTEQDALTKTLDEKQKSKTINEMLKNNSFEGLQNDIQKGLLSGLKEFIPEAELAARGVKTTDTTYDTKMRELITEKSKELRSVRPDSLDNAHVRDALKRVGTPKDWENLASTMKGAGKMVDIWQPDVQRAASRGQNISQVIQQDYNNPELANYANTNPMFRAIIGGQIVRPQRGNRGGRQQRGGQQQGGGQQGGPQGPAPQTPPPTPPSPRGTPIGRPTAQYAGPGGTPPIPPAPAPRGPAGFRPPPPQPPPPPPPTGPATPPNP